MAKHEPWHDPKAVALWVMTALVLWLAIMASPQAGRWVWLWTHPDQQPSASPDSAPAWLSYGLVATGIAIVLVVAVCLWLKLGLWWLLCTLIVSSFFYLLRMIIPEPLGGLLLLIVPPVASALFFKPQAHT